MSSMGEYVEVINSHSSTAPNYISGQHNSDVQGLSLATEFFSNQSCTIHSLYYRQIWDKMSQVVREYTEDLNPNQFDTFEERQNYGKLIFRLDSFVDCAYRLSREFRFPHDEADMKAITQALFEFTFSVEQIGEIFSVLPVELQSQISNIIIETSTWLLDRGLFEAEDNLVIDTLQIVHRFASVAISSDFITKALDLYQTKLDIVLIPNKPDVLDPLFKPVLQELITFLDLIVFNKIEGCIDKGLNLTFDIFQSLRINLPAKLIFVEMFNLVQANTSKPFQAIYNLAQNNEFDDLNQTWESSIRIKNDIIIINSAINDKINVWRAMPIEDALKRIDTSLIKYLQGMNQIITNYNPYNDQAIITLLEGLNSNIDGMKSVTLANGLSGKALKIFNSVRKFSLSIGLTPTPEIYGLASGFEEWDLTTQSLLQLSRLAIDTLKCNYFQSESIVAFAMRNGFTHNTMHLIESLIQWRVKNPEKNFIGEGGYFYNDLDGWGNGMAPLITELTALIDRIFQKNIVGVVES